MAKHYAIADIHGMYDIYEKVCNLLQPDDIIYFLGDAGDRGYDGFRCIKAIYENPQWIYLKGNHEDLMSKGLQDILDEKNGIHENFQYGRITYGDNFELWMFNGGIETFHKWEVEKDYSWIEKLTNLPLVTSYTNNKDITFHMSHAGYTCGNKEEMFPHELLWSRDHFYNTWNEEDYPNDICIHGHTPNEFLVKRYLPFNDRAKIVYKTGTPEAITYCNGHKICIDNGVFYTKSTVLYDLDEMKAIPIYSDSDFEW